VLQGLACRSSSNQGLAYAAVKMAQEGKQDIVRRKRLCEVEKSNLENQVTDLDRDAPCEADGLVERLHEEMFLPPQTS
jgi:hypothetical protein